MKILTPHWNFLGD